MEIAARAVVIPLGVPTEGKGLGLGLAALVHAFVHLEGESVAIAELRPRRDSERIEGAPSPVEAFISPAAWRDMADRGDGSTHVGVVVTGSFQPPVDGHGAIRLLAFDARDGRTRASVDEAVDGPYAGATLVQAIGRLSGLLGGEIGGLDGLKDLPWESLESVLRAERCVLHDPARGGPHDRLAAMLHLGRAIVDAPEARYPAERLASIALEAVMGPMPAPRLAAAALRALERAVDDSSTSLDLVEALAALQVRLGRPEEAEQRMNAVIATHPKRARAYVLASQALRAQGKLDRARIVLQSALEAAGPDAFVAVEQGALLAAGGDLEGAVLAWRDALARDPLNPVAFGRLGAIAAQNRDTAAAQELIDTALGSPHAQADVLRCAVQLVLGSEEDGLARAARLVRLGERILERAPIDCAALLLVARSRLALGEHRQAAVRLDQLQQFAPRSPAAAEAQAVFLAMNEPDVHLEVQSLLRAAHSAPRERLLDVSIRARRLATAHRSWQAWLAAAIAERRRSRWAAARAALEAALEAAPGALPVLVEMAAVLVEIGDAGGAIERLEVAIAQGAPSPRAFELLARALSAVGRAPEALAAARTALTLAPEDSGLHSLLHRLHRAAPPERWTVKVRQFFRTLRNT
jgi:tetratricopeptide (TPR) repeat protein